MKRRRKPSHLTWAILVSLLLNHGLLIPAAYFILFDNTIEVPPQVVEVSLVPDPDEPQVRELPAPAPRAARRRAPRRKIRPKILPRPPRRKKPPKKKVALEKQPPKEKKKPEPPEPTLRMKMVEVNNPESDTPPENARFLSDKNRRVERETRARHTNLVKDSPRPRPLSRPNPRKARKPGDRRSKIAELRKQAGRKLRSRKAPRPHPLLAMRSPLRARRALQERKKLAEAARDGTLPSEQRRQRAAAPRKLQLNLDRRVHDEIYGKQAVRQREHARLSPSTPKGAHDKKWNRIRSSLENFVPEVQPGNQTALGTRAHPFAVYIARMHRGIHKLWGYGFLVDMDNKADSHPMNNMKLWTVIEVAVATDGQVEKATIVKPSGILTFDVAALDTIFSAGPYSSTPRAIRSADGKVYMHWRFHRDQRQCGTFGVDPYILTKPPRGPIDSDLAEVRGGPRRRSVRRLNRSGHAGAGGRQHAHAATSPSARTAPRPPSKSAPGPSSPTPGPAAGIAGARGAALRFIKGFADRSSKAMASASGLPFMTQGRTIATSRSVLRRMFGDLIREAATTRSSGLELMTVMQARKKLGRLPPGAAHGSQMLVGSVTLGGAPATLLLQQRSGSWKVIGLNR